MLIDYSKDPPARNPTRKKISATAAAELRKAALPPAELRNSGKEQPGSFGSFEGFQTLGARKAKICLAPCESGICVGVSGWNERACIQKSPFVGIFTRVRDVLRKFLEVFMAKNPALFFA